MYKIENLKRETIDVTDFFRNRFQVLEDIDRIIIRYEEDVHEIYCDVILYKETLIGKKTTVCSYNLLDYVNYADVISNKDDTESELFSSGSLEEFIYELTSGQYTDIFYNKLKIVKPIVFEEIPF